MWFGFRWVEVAPSPKDHAHDVGDPIEVSVNWTESGAAPVAGVAVKLAAGLALTSGAVSLFPGARTYGLSPMPSWSASATSWDQPVPSGAAQ